MFRHHLKKAQLYIAANLGILSIASSFMGAAAVCGFDCDQGVTAVDRADYINDRSISSNSPLLDGNLLATESYRCSEDVPLLTFTLSFRCSRHRMG